VRAALARWTTFAVLVEERRSQLAPCMRPMHIARACIAPRCEKALRYIAFPTHRGFSKRRCKPCARPDPTRG
jgi:hypothetical protein